MYSKEIKEMYEKINRLRWKAVIISVLLYILLICAVSVFLGSPFPHKVVVIFLEVYESGWIITHIYYLLLCMILAIVVGFLYAIYGLTRIVRSIDDILVKDCDCKKYLEFTESGVKYGRDHKLNGYTKSLFMIMQAKYTVALIANWELDAAEKFLEEEWIGKKTTMNYKNCKINLELISAYFHDDVTKYFGVYDHAPAIFKNNTIFRFYGLVLQDKIDEAIQLLRGASEKTTNGEVIRHFRLGECYIKTGDIVAAKEHIEYVIKYGNMLPAKKVAEEWYNDLV